MDYLDCDISEIDWKSLSHGEIDSILASRTARYETAIMQRGGKRPKREGHVIERIASMENLIEADTEAQKGKRKRKIVKNGRTIRVENRYIRRHNQRQIEELRQLQMMILTLRLPECRFKQEEIKTDAGKTRLIVKQDFFPWRILHHSVLRVIEPKIYASLIPGTFSCIKGRGIHYGVRMLAKMLRRHPELKWFWKTDFKKYYQSIPHELIEHELTSLFKDKHFIRLMRIVLFSYESGEDITQALRDESELTERNTNWRGHKPDDRQSERKAH